MNNDLRKNHFDFIENDTKQRGEIIVSDITFFGALYECRVKKQEQKKSKSVMYSAAESVMNGYRSIK
jgi:hypothetical protein